MTEAIVSYDFVVEEGVSRWGLEIRKKAVGWVTVAQHADVLMPSRTYLDYVTVFLCPGWEVEEEGEK